MCKWENRCRTGTHASGQVIHFVVKYHSSDPILRARNHAENKWTNTEWTSHCEHLANSLNRNLPREIRITHLFRFPVHFPPQLSRFHARRSAQWKQYSYYIQQGGSFMVDWAPFCFYFKEKLDIELMKRELATITGEHEFKNFVNAVHDPTSKTLLTISQIELSVLRHLHPHFPTDPRHHHAQSCANAHTRPAYVLDQEQPRADGEEPSVLRIRIVGSGFLRHMVRRIVGSLRWVGLGKAKPGIFVRVMNDGMTDDDVINETAVDQIQEQRECNMDAEVGIAVQNLKPSRIRKEKVKLTSKKRERKEILGPAVSARGLWLEKVWYGDDWCVSPENLGLGFTPFVDCVYTTTV